MAAGRPALRQGLCYSGVEASRPGDTASGKGLYLSQFPRGGALGKAPGKSRGRAARGRHSKRLHCGFRGKGRKPASGTTSLALGRRSPADYYQAGVPEHGSVITGCAEGLLGGPVARNPPCNARDVGLTLHQGTKIPNTVEQPESQCTARKGPR